MPKCAFCGKEFPRNTGILYVTSRGEELWFCSRKCRINMLELKRKPRKYKWTARYKR
ncbi:MAG: 50S ribosomal protein L24e [Candidatus Njordarchaeia archaeon]